LARTHAKKKTKTNRPTLGGTTGEFFDVLEISETQKQLRRGNVFYDVRTAIKYLKESQKYAGRRIFNDTTMPLLHVLNQNVCVSHYLRIKCLTKKKIGQKQVRNLRGAGPGGRRDVAGTIKTRQREEFEAVTVCVYHDGAFLRLFVLAFKTNNKQCVKSVDKKN
jgi:hypothetical protein